MQSVSHSLARPDATAAPLWRTAVLGLLVVLLTWVIAGSTVQAEWVPGLAVLVQVSLIGVAVMGALALIRPLPWPVGLSLGIVAGPIVAYAATAQMLHRAH